MPIFRIEHWMTIYSTIETEKKQQTAHSNYVSYKTSIHIKRQSEHSIPRIIIIYSTINGCQSTESKIANILNVFNSCKKKTDLATDCNEISYAEIQNE